MRRVAWYGHSTDKYRSAKSFLFAEKTLKIRGGAYELLINYFIFELQLFAKILHNGSESGSMTLANQTHVSVTN